MFPTESCLQHSLSLYLAWALKRRAPTASLLLSRLLFRKSLSPAISLRSPDPPRLTQICIYEGGQATSIKQVRYVGSGEPRPISDLRPPSAQALQSTIAVSLLDPAFQ